MIKAVIFDMDGTILDTLEDLTDSLNEAMRRCGHKHDYEPELVRFFFGSAALVAIERALAVEAGIRGEAALLQIGAGSPSEQTPNRERRREAERILRVYKPYYAEHCRDKTRAYAGIPELIGRLKSAGILTAVVSNKPDEAVQPLCADLFPGLFDFSIGEKEGLRRKPESDMLKACFDALKILPGEAVYVGDTEIDLQTAERAGIPCVSVSWGFRSVEFLKRLGAKAIIERAEELLPLVTA